MGGLPDSQRPRSPVAGRQPDELFSAYGIGFASRFGKDSRGKQQFRGERIEQCLPVPARGMNPEIARVLITDHEMTELMGGCSTAAPRISPKAHDRDGDIAIDH